MRVDIPEAWLAPPDLKAATQVQRDLAERVDRTDRLGDPSILAGVDVSSQRFDPERRIFAGAVAIDASSLAPIGEAHAAGIARFPYVPGYLGFRETPVLVAAARALAPRPDVILVDGHGISHPRALGVATHLGVLLDHPTIGVAKTILCGALAGPLAEHVGARVPLVHRGETIAMALRLRARAAPVFVSIGHKVDLDRAIAVVEAAARGYRLPEPTRRAHLAANAARRAGLGLA